MRRAWTWASSDRRRSAPVTSDQGTEDLLRELAPQVLGVLMRRYAGLDSCEDAVQEALLDAATQWPATGRPDNPRAWLLTVASRRLADIARSDSARRQREDAVFLATPPAVLAGADAWLADDGTAGPRDSDDTLTLLFLCCHPALTPSSQVALTLRAVGGLSTAEIARAFVVPEATMAQRISRAKQQVRAAGARFAPPAAAERDQRLRVVQQVLYLIFNEGYVASAGEALQRVDLAAEGIRLARLLRRLLPDDAETAGLLALMLLTDARRAARVTAGRRARPARGAGPRPLGPAAHRRGRRARRADAGRVARARPVPAPGRDRRGARRGRLGRGHRLGRDPRALRAAGPGIAGTAGLPRAGGRRGHGPRPAAGLAAADELAGALARHHRFHAVRGHLLEMSGDPAGAAAAYDLAARYATNAAEKRYLSRQARLVRGH